jgi:hypothetical protein
MNPHESDQLESRIRDALDEPLDKDIRQRLAVAREQTLQQKKVPMWRARALPAMAFAVVCAIALVLLNQPTIQLEAPDSVEAFEIISSPDELEMYQDLEFYAWMAVQEEQGV